MLPSKKKKRREKEKNEKEKNEKEKNEKENIAGGGEYCIDKQTNNR